MLIETGSCFLVDTLQVSENSHTLSEDKERVLVTGFELFFVGFEFSLSLSLSLGELLSVHQARHEILSSRPN